MAFCLQFQVMAEASLGRLPRLSPVSSSSALCVSVSVSPCICVSVSLSLCLNQPRLPFPFWIMQYNERKRRDPGVKGSEQLKRIDSFLGYVFLISHLQAPCETSTLRVTHFPQPSTQGYEVPRTRCGLGPCLLTDLDPTMCWSRGKSTEREDDAGKEIAVLLDSAHTGPYLEVSESLFRKYST